MNKKTFGVVLFVLVLLSINFCVAQDVDNATSEDAVLASTESEVLEAANDTSVLSASKTNTHIDVKSNTTFDVIGDEFKIKLSDANNKAISKAKVTFTVDGKTYSKNTNSYGIASLQLRVNDGTYKIVTKYAGSSNYKASSLTTTIKMTNTRVVDAGLSNSEIQSIIDHAKVNNVILFKGSSYSDINLVITKSLTLVSYVDTTLKSGSSSPVITVKGSKASLTKIKGFNIQGNGNGIEVDGANYVTIYGNDITTKANGIVALNTKNLEISKNNIVKNSKNGITLALTENTYIHGNTVSNNGRDGIDVGKSTNTHIYDNIISSNKESGIYAGDSINGVKYSSGPQKLYITQNTINSNGYEGIGLYVTQNNIQITKNTLKDNYRYGVSLGDLGSNLLLQSNVITNSKIGIDFSWDYMNNEGHDISYNALILNEKAIEAYDLELGGNSQLEIGDNWIGDYGFVCPKIKMNRISYAVKQIGENTFAATFYDSNGNIASLLPDRILEYEYEDGKYRTMTISGGTAVFTSNAEDKDLVQTSVDLSERSVQYDSSKPNSDISKYQGKSTNIPYNPDIEDYQLYEDIGRSIGAETVDIGSGNGDGSGIGGGSGGPLSKGDGKSDQESSDSTGNSTTSQQMNPSTSSANPVNDVTQTTGASTSSQASASESSSGDSSSAGKSVSKQIVLDEDEIVKVTGILFIVLVIILTIGFYYRDDIDEMKSKL